MAAYSNQGELVAENLHGIASEVRIVSLPGITKKGGDVFDWLEASDDPDQLLNIANAAPIWEPDAPLVKFSDEQSLPNGHEPAETVTVAPAFSDVALSLRFIERHASSLRYEAALGKWFRYDGTRWVTENTLHAFDCARRICQEAAAESNKSSIARAIASAKTVAAVERLAKANHRLASTTDQWDTNLWLLNTPDGAVDLKTGKMRAHQPNDYFTKTTAVSPSTANCPRWKSHLHRVLDGNAELIAYVQRVFGYCLTGVTTEHALFFCYGTGGNGKGETLHTVANILKDYAQSASIMTFIASPFDRHLTELATLRGARAVTATETEKNRGWKESLIKQLTGGDVIRANFMRQDTFEFLPQLKLLISGNHKPSLQSVDEAMRRRLHLIPFTVTIPPEEKILGFADNILKEEWPAILNWIIEGCLEWQRIGLSPPIAVRDATTAYLDAQDSFAAWLEECCDVGPNTIEARTALYASWSVWAKASGEEVGGARSFYETLDNHGFEKTKHVGKRQYKGLKVKLKPASQHWTEKDQ